MKKEIDMTERRMPRGIYRGTREEWLEEAANIMGVWIDATPTMQSKKKSQRYSHQKVRFSCSLLGGGMTKSGALAHCHYKQATGNGYHEIRMGVHIDGRKKMRDSARIADIVLHEMIHTVTFGHGHRGDFRKVAIESGLEGRMTATVASKELTAKITEEVVRVLGKYPHKKVHLIPRGQRKKGSRLVKCECTSCGCIIRLTRKWINEAVNHITCPICVGQMEVSL